ncbi:MAG: hypothetical protein QOH46_1909, partial [Solirubrobacteraceae bacterium]|nr:hypothetical protein [Solirubrobacteraceae bacterium]
TIDRLPVHGSVLHELLENRTERTDTTWP